LEVLAKVLSEDVQRPTLRASEVHGKVRDTSKDEDVSLDVSVPPELEDLCLKALAKEKSDRFSSAAELASEIQSFLEGEKTREWMAGKARERISHGEVLTASLEKMRAEIVDRDGEIEKRTGEVMPHWPAAKKRRLWDLERERKELGGRIVKTFGLAVEAFQEALGFEKDNEKARAALADLYWGQFLREEQAGDAGQMLFFEGLVRQYHDGRHEEKLRGDGKLEIRTRRYPCGCLGEGRSVSPGELEVMGYHPSSGRDMAPDQEKESQGAEPLESAPIKVHGSRCETVEVAGASVWLFKLEERDKILAPVLPRGLSNGVECGPVDPSANAPEEGGPGADELRRALDDLFDPSSPTRPVEGLFMGTTPMGPFPIPMGSYLVVVSLEGCRPVRMPVHVTRLESQSLEITLFGADEIPEEFVQVPGGRFIYHGDVDNPYSGPAEIAEVPDFFISRFPVRCSEYLSFLNDPEELESGRSGPRVPREAGDAGPYWPRLERGEYALPSEAWLASAPAEAAAEAKRLAQAPEDWRVDWPVMAVSWNDAMSFSRWRSKGAGYLICLPHEVMWEKAARGTDGRLYAWGSEFEDTYQNSIRTEEGPNRPLPVESMPVDESPYGVRGVGGNSVDWCLNQLDDGRRLLRGGSWLTYGVSLRLTARMAGAPVRIGHGNGFRMALLPQVPFGDRHEG
ncbi:MAG: SUMF1/EgtB/PvdO family nonheme iron enzyme, partial [Planctomycetota bacterium]